MDGEQRPKGTMNSARFTELRQRAEEKVKKLTESNVKNMTPMEIQRILHELNIHQIELEMQNEELMQSQHELDQARKHYYHLFNDSPTGYAVLDKSGQIEDVNNAFVRLVQKQRSEIIGRPFHDFIASESQDAYYLLKRGLNISNQMHKDQLRLSVMESSTVDVIAEIRFRNPERKGGGSYLVTLTDISELKQTQGSLDEALQELKVAYQELEAYGYTIAHDLRAPVRQMSSFVLLLKEQLQNQGDAEATDLMQRIENSSAKMKELIEDLFVFSTLQNRELKQQTIDLNRIAQQSVNKLRQQYQDATVEVEIDSGLHTLADKGLMQIVFDNLIGNAWKFSLGEESPRIEVGREWQDGQELFYVKDNGVGFKAERPGEIFEPFKRLHSSKDFEGTGIGLAIVKRIIQSHFGDVWAASKPGSGTTVYFTVGRG